MKLRLIVSLLACGAMLATLPARATDFDFAVLHHPPKEETGDTSWLDALKSSDEEDLFFIVANGIKSASEPCDDTFYEGRHALLERARNGLIVSLAASDWTECRTRDGKPASVGRLNRLRELFFAEEFSLGGTKLPLTRQSTIVRFRSFAENARWEFDDLLFATINLPRNNNHYSAEAGRNVEFDERQIANKDWIQRLFSHAKRKKLKAIVLFSDANPLIRNERPPGNRDGFGEIRKAIVTAAAKFPGKVLLVPGRIQDGRATDTQIVWNGNLGMLETRNRWAKVEVRPGTSTLFAVSAAPADPGKDRPKPPR